MIDRRDRSLPPGLTRSGEREVAPAPRATERVSVLAVALGGHALMAPGQAGSIPEQIENARIAMKEVADLAEHGHERLLITHGNGPQVGNILRRSEMLAKTLYTLPLDVCVADSQGGIGYTLQRQLVSELARRGIEREVATVLTTVLVDPDDPEFEDPSKPIGMYYKEREAYRHRRQHGWPMVETKHGWRRVVPSPKPLEVIEAQTIRTLLDAGVIVIAAGGGGIPVYWDESGELQAVEGVIDKDRATALLAGQVGASVMAIVTPVDGVFINWGKENEQLLGIVTASELKAHLESGQFPKGSMGPKVESAVDFVERGGKLSIITRPSLLPDALAGLAGTRVVPG